ncbi:MAG: hypothetical protein SVM86_03510 [Candidatus Cloacimonadota bacterium]|nr:hypothetical protein [Candidatus Cloacimonadota bacterium]
MIYLFGVLLFLTVLNVLLYLKRKQQEERTLNIEAYYDDIAPFLELYAIQKLEDETENSLCFLAKDKRSGKNMKLHVLKKIYHGNNAKINEFYDRAYESGISSEVNIYFIGEKENIPYFSYEEKDEMEYK